ncbi:hypothetical protein Pelo_10535 [Pelomyxa schiedti]|nr:hypothetical protein Pelo_10535 [Pelomyxa schiedti]
MSGSGTKSPLDDLCDIYACNLRVFLGNDNALKVNEILKCVSASTPTTCWWKLVLAAFDWLDDVCTQCTEVLESLQGVRPREEMSTILESLQKDCKPTLFNDMAHRDGNNGEEANDAFGKLLQRLRIGSRVNVTGDGNCLFRAALKSTFPSFQPEELELHFCLALREQLNSKSLAPDLEVFATTGDTDSVTMSRSGVWADSVQCMKLAIFLERPVHILRCDDRETQFDGRRLHVGKWCKFGDYPCEPIFLYYIPTPGHFDGIAPFNYVPSTKEQNIQEELASLEAKISTFSATEVHQSCETFCSVYAKLVDVQLLFPAVLSETDQDVRMVMAHEVNNMGTFALNSLAKMKNIISNVGGDTIKRLCHKVLPLHYMILSEIISDAIAFEGETLLMQGDGIVSTIYMHVQSSLESIKPGSTALTYQQPTASMPTPPYTGPSAIHNAFSPSYRPPAIPDGKPTEPLYSPPTSNTTSIAGSNTWEGSMFSTTTTTPPAGTYVAEPTVESLLISAPTTSAADWQAVSSCTMLQFHQVTVSMQGAASLVSAAIHGCLKNRLRNLEFYNCVIPNDVRYILGELRVCGVEFGEY